jgi:hypothetical protein
MRRMLRGIRDRAEARSPRAAKVTG